MIVKVLGLENKIQKVEQYLLDDSQLLNKLKGMIHDIKMDGGEVHVISLPIYERDNSTRKMKITF